LRQLCLPRLLSLWCSSDWCLPCCKPPFTVPHRLRI